jgi:hypothetical protein
MGEHRGLEHEGPLLEDHSANRLDNSDDLIVLSETPGQDLLIRFVRRYLKIFFIVRAFKSFRIPQRPFMNPSDLT